MARTKRTTKTPKIDTPTARARLAPQREPYWASISPGCSLGYRRGANGGTWLARRYDPAAATPRRFAALGAADDALRADGVVALSYAQAHERAREWFAAAARAAQGIEPEPAGGYTVGHALDAYLERLRAEGKLASLADARSRCRTTIRPALGKLEVARLTAARLRKFLNDIAAQPRFVRGAAGQSARPLSLPATDAARRARRSTANRTWTVLRAALNGAFVDGKVGTDAAWRRVKGFRNADAARGSYLTAAEAQRLVNACPPDFRALVTAALLSGARYGELTRLNVDDFDAAAGTLRVQQSKTGRPRHVYLSADGQSFFAALALGKGRADALLRKSNGARWGAAQQVRPMAAAVQAARIDTPLTFHGFRHAYASAAIMAGTPLQVVAANLGHSSTRMVEKHYGHLARNWLAEATRATAPTWGLGPPAGNVEPIRRAT